MRTRRVAKQLLRELKMTLVVKDEDFGKDGRVGSVEATGCGGPAGEEVTVDQEACYGKDDYREGGHGPE